MGLVQHVGHWPFPDQTGTGPLATDGYFGDGSGCVIDVGATPYYQPHFPLAFPTKGEAMWHFWRVKTWSLTIATVAGFLDGTQLLSPYVWDGGAGPQIAEEEDLICCRNGIVYQVERVVGALNYNAYLYINAVDSVGDTQVAYNPLTALWLPKIRIVINYFKDTVPEDAVTLETNGSPPDFSCTLNGKTVILGGSGDVTSIVFAPEEMWPHGGMW